MHRARIASGLLIAGTLGAVADAILTLGLLRSGTGSESYPPAAWVIDHFGILPALALMVIVAILCMALLRWMVMRLTGLPGIVPLTGLLLAVLLRWSAAAHNVAFAIAGWR
jgi:hypothetical protein